MQACIPGVNCSVPVTGDGSLFSSFCVLFPDAPGCLGNGFSTPFIPPYLGDYDTETLLGICNCLNGGLCSQACFYILPGENPFILRSEEDEQRQKRHQQGEEGECEGENADDPWRVIRYGDLSPRQDFGYGGWQAHHGVSTTWMENVFNSLGRAGSAYNGLDAPALLMPAANHFRTFQQIPMNGNWSDIYQFALDAFTRSNTSGECKEEYWKQFKEYAKRIICELIVEGAVYAELPVNVQSIWRFASDNGSTDTICRRIGTLA